MLVGLIEKPTEWESIEEGKFFIINSLHNIDASRWIVDDANGIDEETKKHFQKWDYFVVWLADEEKL